ncbi:hypothetical protein SADUNF_Sadunf06G0102800 [Salix dunnii]|uniref:non-specific serine/threonine protein kinase n=1 Tax=Salix dunnii TaxID=1413687 RepID=A0A835K3Z9_9ROSI|nr:hypothetical protein SADUNF_Sadunf06G0102800 [Salix dunnii]
MKCFSFYNGDKKDEPKTPKSVFVHSVNSSGTDHEIGRSGSELNSQNVTGGGRESMGRPSLPSMSQRHSNLRVFTVSELKSATKNFSRSVMVGEGGFGCVYKGSIKSTEDPTTKLEIAVKQLDKPLPWAMRLRIAQDAARGLKYLHEEMDFQIIFRDFKSSNILLDEQWNAKLSDFGLARLGPSEGLTHVSTASRVLACLRESGFCLEGTCTVEVVGTMGYAAPEYIQTGRLTSKSDVWSYGVFLYELITGRRPLDRNRPKSEQKLLEWIRPYLSDAKKFKQIVDPRLEQKDILKSAHKLANIANRCLVRNPKSRPKMSEVLEMMDLIVNASTGAESAQQSSKNSAPITFSRDTTAKNKRRNVDLKTGESGWFGRIWSPKYVRTC